MSDVAKRSSAESISIPLSVKISESFASVVIAMRDATSPAAWPPIPSATAMIELDVRAESSLPARTSPTADLPAVAKKSALICS